MFSFRGLRGALVGLVLCGVAGAGAAQTSPVTRSSNVRETASRTAAIVGRLHAGDLVTVLSWPVSAGYVHVRMSDGTEGWVFEKNIGSAAGTGTGTGGFTQSCAAPNYPTATPTVMDGTSCTVAGNGGQETNQNEQKNNFCATGPAQAVTVADMVALQAQVPASVPFGNPDDHPLRATAGPAVDRSALAALGEGQEVVVTGYLSFTAQEGEESVNCGSSVPNLAAYHDIHMNIVSAANGVECDGIVAEMIPHYRPNGWNSTVVAQVQSAHVFVRVTGNRMFDSSHTPCVSGKAVPSDPARASLWEVHPIYKFEVCPTGTCDAGGWVDLEAWKP